MILTDCLERVDVELPEPLPHAERCVASVVSPGYERHLDGLLRSLDSWGGCADASRIVFAVGGSAEIDRVAARYGARLIRCRPRGPLNAMVKALLYSAARVIAAEKLLCLDADLLVLGDLSPLFAALDVLPERSILACRDWNDAGFKSLSHSLATNYGGSESDVSRLLGRNRGEGRSTLVVNDGVFAGRRQALAAIDECIRGMRKAADWIGAWPVRPIRNQFVFNLALAHLGCGVAADDVYNLQLHAHDAAVTREGGRPRAVWKGREVRVLHFCADGRTRYEAVRALLD